MNNENTGLRTLSRQVTQFLEEEDMGCDPASHPSHGTCPNGELHGYHDLNWPRSEKGGKVY